MVVIRINMNSLIDFYSYLLTIKLIECDLYLTGLAHQVRLRGHLILLPLLFSFGKSGWLISAHDALEVKVLFIPPLSTHFKTIVCCIFVIA